MLVIPVLGSLRQKDQMFKVSLGYRWKPCFKKQNKKACGVAQVVEHPPSKYEALGSNPNTEKKQNPEE
jgi:hypothetical protein